MCIAVQNLKIAFILVKSAHQMCTAVHHLEIAFNLVKSAHQMCTAVQNLKIAFILVKSAHPEKIPHLFLLRHWLLLGTTPL